MRNLFWISILIFVLAGCSTGKKAGTANQVPVAGTEAFFGNNFEKALFTGSLDIKKHHLTGFLLIKKMDENTQRIVFTNQIGMTIFDFELRQDTFKVVYCFESLNRKALIQILEKDFRLLLKCSGDKVSKGFFDKAELNFFDLRNHFPGMIRIKNPRIGLEMKFTLLNR